jgi:hypothetical protein
MYLKLEVYMTYVVQPCRLAAVLHNRSGVVKGVVDAKDREIKNDSRRWRGLPLS